MEASERMRHRVVPVEEIPEDDGVLVEIGDRDIGIFKVDGELYAYENRCLHQGGPVCTGTILGRTRLVLNEVGEVLREIDDNSEKRLICPWHGWEYDIKTGELAHDRRYHLRRHAVVVEDGVVYVEV